MRLGLNLGYMVGADDAGGQLRLTQHAESLGYEVVWAAEAYGSDSPTRAGLAGRADHHGSGRLRGDADPGADPRHDGDDRGQPRPAQRGRFSSVSGCPGRRYRRAGTGCGSTGRWRRTREYVDIVRAALARKTVAYEGRTYRLPLPDGPGKALKLTIAPHATDPDLSGGRRSEEPRVGRRDRRRLVGGLLRARVRRRAARPRRRGRPPRDGSRGLRRGGDFPLVVGADPRACADPVRPYAALYLGGMGSREKNFYNSWRSGWATARPPATVQDLYPVPAPAGRDGGGAVRVHRLDLAARSRERLAERLAEFAAAGVTTCAWRRTATPSRRSWPPSRRPPRRWSWPVWAADRRSHSGAPAT